MATVMRGPLVAELAGVWPETPWLLEQAARARQTTSATTTIREKPALPPWGMPPREHLP